MAACRMDLRLHKNPYGTILHIVIILAKPQDLKKREDFETKAGDLGVIPLKMSN